LTTSISTLPAAAVDVEGVIVLVGVIEGVTAGVDEGVIVGVGVIVLVGVTVGVGVGEGQVEHADVTVPVELTAGLLIDTTFP
jgi:hypothetical protein